MSISTFFWFIGVVLLLVGMTWFMVSHTTFEETGKCYDRYGSEIIGISCLTTVSKTDDGSVGCLFIGLFLFLFGYFWSITDEATRK